MEPIENVTLPLNIRGESALAAIVFTDVEAFTMRMAADEKHALGLIERDFQLMSALCKQFEGQVLKSLGDGLLMYFVSAEKAVSCAIEIQLSLAQAAIDLPAIEVLSHRIGIHLGDVVFSGTDVMGNGVNIAARLQGEAEPGRICISQTVYDVVKAHLPLPVTYLGLRKLRGIPEMVPVHQISPPRPVKSSYIFISYRNQDPDLSLAQQFYDAFVAAGHQIFMAGESIRLGEKWPARIDAELQQCDYLLLLLSEESAMSEMVTEEVRRAKELRESRMNGKPMILPIRVNFPWDSPLNYNLRGYLDCIQQREWRSPADTQIIVPEVINLVSKGVVWGPECIPPVASTLETTKNNYSDRTIAPLPVALPELPEGQVGLDSAFYVERPPIEARCYEMVLQPGSLIRIKAPRQMGKTSLIARILHQAAQQGHQTVVLSFQLADRQIFTDLDRFLRWLCAKISRRLELPNQISASWDEMFGSKDNCTAYFEDYLLPNINSSLVLALDEVDCVFQHPEIADDFFGLLRAWHEEAKNRDIWKKLHLVIVHSTEVYIPLSINQSPFNVGLPIELPEFTLEQVHNLAQWHQLNWEVPEVEQLMAMIGGHPYLVRLALYTIRRQEITLAQLLSTAPTEAGLYGDHLRRQLWILEQHPELMAAVKEVVATNQPLRLEALQAFKLHSMGLVRLQGNEVMPRSNLYSEYFRDRFGIK